MRRPFLGARAAALAATLFLVGAPVVAWGEPAKMDAMSEELVELFKQGRPDFRGEEIVALAQLYEGLPSADQPQPQTESE